MRYNIFNNVHLPLKTALLSGCIFISKITNGESTDVAEALKKAEEALEIFNEQVTFEALHVLPFIFEYEPSVCNNYTSRHHKATRLANSLKSLLQSCHKQKRHADKLAIMKLVNESYNEFMLFNFNHMQDEEAVLNEILWTYYPDPVIRQIEEEMNILPHLVKQQHRAGFQILTAA